LAKSTIAAVIAFLAVQSFLLAMVMFQHHRISELERGSKLLRRDIEMVDLECEARVAKIAADVNRFQGTWIKRQVLDALGIRPVSPPESIIRKNKGVKK
jgi:hypothetical protein